jgi:hypothetical protein
MFKELNDVITTSQLTLPALELALHMVLLTLCLLFRYSRTGILIAYIFSYRWGWKVASQLGDGAFFGYLIFGMIVGVLSIIGLLSESKA